MMSTYLSESADALDGLDCLPMVEAGELGHVEVVGRTSRHANRGSASSFEWVRPIQERHFRYVRGLGRRAKAEASRSRLRRWRCCALRDGAPRTEAG